MRSQRVFAFAMFTGAGPCYAHGGRFVDARASYFCELARCSLAFPSWRATILAPFVSTRKVCKRVGCAVFLEFER
jgi:hypothetical protein